MTLDTVWYPNTVFFPFACHNFPFMRILLYEHRHIFDGDFPILLVLCGAEDRYEMDRLESSRLHNEVMMRFDQVAGLQQWRPMEVANATGPSVVLPQWWWFPARSGRNGLMEINLKR